ncbi:sugar ABC transporter substrate-binding protein [Microbacterium sp. ARD31]|uniref:ABC transporter substrate-binding protein n=1 Tax=Microbacterium sp. ARD31 TaxID=2962576 RepID=UPI00288299A2|nr:sugar ABC transporter substrate-binding protein [Microbacterium sp. ARD31]MDT0183942.1 sugar ABC transporter substrate-binding protein [Microbacterium sp. ARD31]
MKTIRCAAFALSATLVLSAMTGCAAGSQTPTISFRLWDPQVADAYRQSFAEFTARTGIDVDIVVIPWADYWTQLRADVASGTVDDVFWTNAANFAMYAESDHLIDIRELLSPAAEEAWEPDVVAQYTLDGGLWGVPQLTDPGIGIIYNADLLAAAGVSVREVEALAWDPTTTEDTLRSVATRLTADVDGRTPDDAGFDATSVAHYGYNASNDLNAIILQFLGSNDAAWQIGDRFAFDSEAGRESIQYVVNLINDYNVAPPASDTNPPTGGDRARDLFLQGRLALFQTGAYNLANVVESADFEWGIAPLPAGPAGAISVTNGVVAAASADSDDPDSQRRLLEWIASPEGSREIGADGSGLPAVTAAQSAYFEYWRSKGVDISPMLDVLENGTIQAPSGARYSAAETAYRPILNEVFVGRVGVDIGLRDAQAAANAALDPR